MAIARCDRFGRPTGGNVKPPGYAERPYLPVGHPNSGVVCGKPDCENDGLIWLKLDDAMAYGKGQRIFEIHTQTAKVKLQ